MDQNSTPTAPPRNPRRDWFAFDRSDRWGMGILLALTVALLATGSLLIVAVMRTIAAGDPFVAANVRRMRQLAALLLVGPFFAFFLSMSVHGALLGDVDLGGLALSAVLDIPWAWFVAGMVVALLAEAFKAGSRLRDDVEGLV